MRKKLLTAALLFILLLAGLALLLTSQLRKSESIDMGDYAVAANEIEQLIENAEHEAARQQAQRLESALSEFENRSSGGALMLWLMFAAAALIIAGAFAYIWLNILRPFKTLEKYADSIAAGNLDIALDYERENYFGRFTWAFDSMRREIVKARNCEKEAIDNNKTVIATLSHDIKTPIASIRAYAEGLDAGLASNPEKQRRYLSVIMSKCDEVARLTNDMFLHSLSDLEKLRMNPEITELGAFLETVTADIGGESGDLFFEKPALPITVSVDRNRLTQIIGNAVTNARKYAKTKIDMKLSQREGFAEISIRDYGGGIDDEDLPFIFGKFYRGKNCGSEQGSGLGLYIVKYVAEQSGGSVELNSSSEGLELKIYLPLYKS